MDTILPLFDKYLLPFLLGGGIGAFTDRYWQYRRDKVKAKQIKEQKLTDIEKKARKIIQRISRYRFSKPLLNYDFQMLRGDILNYCDEYDIERKLIGDGMIDLAIEVTGDAPRPDETSSLFSELLNKLKMAQ